MTGAAYARGQNDGVYRTPDDFRAAIVERWGTPACDLACDASNQFGLCGITEADDSLALPWAEILQDDLGWLNSPFDPIAPWAEKCAREQARVLSLWPAAVGSNWFRDFVHKHARVHILNGRMSFDGLHPYPKDLILCEYGLPRSQRTITVWKWRGEEFGRKRRNVKAERKIK